MGLAISSWIKKNVISFTLYSLWRSRERKIRIRIHDSVWHVGEKRKIIIIHRLSYFREDSNLYVRFFRSSYLDCMDRRFLLRFLSCRRFFSALARSMYFFLWSGVIRVQSLPAIRAITVTCSFGFLLRNRRKKMMNGFVARDWISSCLSKSREFGPTGLLFPCTDRLPFPVSALRERQNCKVRFCVFHWSCVSRWLTTQGNPRWAIRGELSARKLHITRTL